MSARIDLIDGWSLVEDEKRQWFLCNPAGIWVAHFWDGPEAGKSDACSFAEVIARGIEARRAETRSGSVGDESPTPQGARPESRA
jgi:hypothetical protein